MIKNYLKIFLVVIFCQAAVLAQSFTASVNNTTVGVNDQFQISFTFSGQDINGIKSFTPPKFYNFMILSGPNQSTSMQIINSSVSASRTYSYYLQPKNMGTFNIESASIDYNGKIFKSNPVAITVVKGSPKHKAKTQGNATISDKEIGENLFIRAVADRNKVYMGQQVTVTYELYTRLGIASQMSVSKLPSYEGFWSEEITVPNNITFTTEVYNGKQYRVGILKKVALFPTQLGELSVTPFELNVPVQIQRRKQSGNIFDDFFNNPFFNNTQAVNYDAKSNTLHVKVLPLPNQNVPKTFNGAVGDYTINSQLDKTDTKTNQPVDLKINITGTGNIQLLNLPEVNLPPGLDKYEPKTSDQVNRTGIINGSKTIDYLLVPRTPGKKEIPPVKFSFFNPSKHEYVTVSTQPYTISVAQGPASEQNIAGYSKEDIKVLDQDIRYIKTSPGDISRIGSAEIFGFGFWSSVILPFAALIGLVSWKRRNDKLAGNLQLLRYRRAEKIARTRFKNAKTLMESNDQTGFYSEISLALFGYLEDKLHISKAEISLDRAVEELNKKNVDESLLLNLKNCTEKCEYARFAPSGNGSTEMNEMYNEMTNVIIELEKSLSPKKYS
ncbi:MAG: BatD family protein [Ignavibacteriaceae bacterium]